MTDRELLELAAKAAGIGPLDFDYAERDGHGIFSGPRLPMPTGVLMAAMHTYWNPLEIDGDALRLSSALQLCIDHSNPLESSAYVSAWRCGIEMVRDPISAIEECDGEPGRLAATRRAITRAAAKIGKAIAIKDCDGPHHASLDDESVTERDTYDQYNMREAAGKGAVK